LFTEVSSGQKIL